MKESFIFFLIISNAAFVSTIFWIISILGKHTYSAEPNKDKRESFECGFENNSKGYVSVHSKNTMAFIFLIIYEIEFLILLPVSFNVISLSVVSKLFSFFIILTIMYTCLLDVEFESLSYDN